MWFPFSKVGSYVPYLIHIKNNRKTNWNQELRYRLHYNALTKQWYTNISKNYKLKYHSKNGIPHPWELESCVQMFNHKTDTGAEGIDKDWLMFV